MDNNLNLLLEFLREERSAFAEYIKDDDYFHEDESVDYDEGYSNYQDEQLEIAHQSIDELIERISTNGLSKSDASEILDWIDQDEEVLAEYLENAGENGEVEDEIRAYIERVFK